MRTGGLTVRPLAPADFAGWLPLWDGYNAFYGRSGETALPRAVTEQTWRRMLDEREPMWALVAELSGTVVGLVHCIVHASTSRAADVCYLQDLFTAPAARGRGVAGALIEAVYARAQALGCGRVYWHTQAGNTTARRLYDRLAEHRGFVVYSHDF